MNTKKMTQDPSNKTQDVPSEEGDKKEEAKTLFGKWLVFLYEATFVITILIFGTLVGTLLALVLPLGFPLLILWKRYVKDRNG